MSLVSPALAGGFFTTVPPALQIANSMCLDYLTEQVSGYVETQQSRIFFSPRKKHLLNDFQESESMTSACLKV